MGYIKVRIFGDTAQVYEYEKSLPIRRKSRKANSYTKRDRKNVARSADSFRRAKRAFQCLVRANIRGDEPPTLLTFTMHQKLPYSASSVIFTRFIKRLRRRAGESFRHIAVPEFQERGAVHWHVLLWGLPVEYGCVGYFRFRRGKKVFVETCPPERQCERKTRRFARVWLRGFTDAIATDGSPKLAGYLSKYMSKSMLDIRLGGKRAYYTSHNVVRPLSFSSGTLPREAAVSLALYHAGVKSVDNSPLQEREFGTEWLGNCNYSLLRVEPYEAGKSTTDDPQGRA